MSGNSQCINILGDHESPRMTRHFPLVGDQKHLKASIFERNELRIGRRDSAGPLSAPSFEESGKRRRHLAGSPPAFLGR
jgi:hypothetical protein